MSHSRSPKNTYKYMNTWIYIKKHKSQPATNYSSGRPHIPVISRPYAIKIPPPPPPSTHTHTHKKKTFWAWYFLKLQNNRGADRLTCLLRGHPGVKFGWQAFWLINNPGPSIKVLWPREEKNGLKGEEGGGGVLEGRTLQRLEKRQSCLGIFSGIG